MYKFETYKSNLDLDDKHNVHDVRLSKTMICSNISLITKPKSDPKTKFSPIVAAVLGLDNTAASRYPSVSRRADFKTWTDIDAQQWFLDSKPTCYLVVGKPGAGVNSLAEAIAKKTNCVHLSPMNIIQDEIDQGTPTGKAIDFNMRHNGVCNVHIILAILKKKLESAVIKHRGYILSGLPLVTTSSKPLYLFKTLDSEEAIMVAYEIIFDLVMHFKKSKSKRAQSERTSESSFNAVEGEGDLEEQREEEHEEGLEEEEEQPIVLPKYLLDQCSDVIEHRKCVYGTKKGLLHKQLNEIFNPGLRPDIILYISCPDAALTTKKMHKYFNYKTNSMTFDPFLEYPDENQRWPVKCALSDYVKPIHHIEFQPKYNCRLPINFPDLTIEQMCNYRRYVQTYVEKKVEDYNPKHIIKVDARISIHEMAYQVTERTQSLPTNKPVLIPEPLYMEDAPEEMEEFWKMVEEWNVIRHGPVTFNRYASPWYTRCPVELKKGRSVVGKPKFAASFFRHVYLLSSLNNLIDFCKNPRPFLNLYHLEPTCRVVIMGTKSSGKSMISACISWIFGAKVIDFNAIEQTEYTKKRDNFCNSILSEIIANIEDDRLEKWKIAEVDRMTKLNEWNSSNINDLKKYIPLLRDYTDAMMQPGSEMKIDKKLTNNYRNMREKLLFLPFVDDIDLCKDAIKERDLIMYAPAKLTRAAEKPITPVIGDADVTQAINDYIVANDLQKEIDPSPEDLMAEIITSINNIDAEVQEKSNSVILYGKYIIDGMPSDPEYWNILSESKLLPDYTITIIENRELEPDMIKHYIKLETCVKNHQERFVLADDPLVHISMVTKKITEEFLVNIQMIVHDLIDKVLDSIFPESEESKEMETTYLSSFNQAVEKFREGWDSVKLRLEEYSKFYTEIHIENKTDIQILEDVLLSLRKAYFPPLETIEGEEDLDNEGESGAKNYIFHNHPNFLCETGTYCPIAFYDHRVLWEGKPEFSCKYGNKLHYFSKEECMEKFKKDPSKYQAYNKPYKDIPPLRICIMGCFGSGKTSVTKIISKELGLLHVDFAEIINYFLMPRHVKKVGIEYENKFTDEPIDEETVMDFQMAEENENMSGDILSNETELRRMVYNYLERGTPLVPHLLHKVLRKLWDVEPFSRTGFILDGFPRTPSDVEEMVAIFCVPDLVIELESNMELSIDRLMPGFLKKWKIQQNEAKALAKKKLENAKENWNDFITKQVVVKLIIDDIFEELAVTTADQLAFIPSTQSMIMDSNPQGSTNVDHNLFNTYNEMIQEYPEPIDDTVWEKSDDARELLESRIESIYETEDESIQNLKEILIEQRIKIIPVDASKPLNKVSRVVLSQLSIIRNRNMSLFEQTFVLSMEVAELLLSQGFYFLSKFSRMGPVYIYNHPKAIQNSYKASKFKGIVYPVAHRSHIYFVNGDQALEMLRADPLKYIDSDNILSYHEFPLRIGIIGPPKSGKSAIAATLAKKYGLMCITRGSALRTILEKMRWTKLASQIMADLQAGRRVEPELIVNSVLTVVNDHRATSHGFVLDGFPEFTTVAKKLLNVGLYPITLFDIQASKQKILNNSQNEIYYDIYKHYPPYSATFIENRYDLFKKSGAQLRHYVKTEIQNLTLIDGNVSRWQCVQDIKKHIDNITPLINHYLNHVATNIVNVDVMCISPEIFEQNQSCFKDHCPVCLSNNVLRHSRCGAGRKGIVQYKGLFYWICSEHTKKVMTYPDHFLNARYVDIPEVPVMVSTINPSYVYENGVCIVTYAEHLPAQVFKPGLKEYAVSFKGNTYMLCCDICLEKFLLKPLMYYDITIFKEPTKFPKLELKKLPDIGYLEQVFGNILTDACCYVNVLRPKYPGLSVDVSGLIFVALFLKTRNYYTKDSVRALYTKAYKKYEARSKLIIQLGLRLRSMDNPFANYPKCCEFKKTDSGTVCKPPSAPKLPSQTYFASRSQDDLTFNPFFPE